MHIDVYLLIDFDRLILCLWFMLHFKLLKHLKIVFNLEKDWKLIKSNIIWFLWFIVIVNLKWWAIFVKLGSSMFRSRLGRQILDLILDCIWITWLSVYFIIWFKCIHLPRYAPRNYKFGGSSCSRSRTSGKA